MTHVYTLGWSGGAMVLGKLPTILITVGQGPIALAVGAGGVVWTFLLSSILSLSHSLWETARYRLKYCLKGPLNPKQPTNVYTRFQVYGYTSIFFCHFCKGEKFSLLSVCFSGGRSLPKMESSLKGANSFLMR